MPGRKVWTEEEERIDKRQHNGGMAGKGRMGRPEGCGGGRKEI